jgi:DNA-binding MarR family transcriptional regulator
MRCLCATVRRTGRLLTRQYEDALRPAGMTVSQFELMNTVRAMEPVDQSRLAKQLENDQTTLSRNIKLLLELGWVTTDAGQDGRQRSYRLSETGLKTLREAARHWQRMHDRMEATLGLSELWPILDRIQDAARAEQL